MKATLFAATLLLSLSAQAFQAGRYAGTLNRGNGERSVLANVLWIKAGVWSVGFGPLLASQSNEKFTISNSQRLVKITFATSELKEFKRNSRNDKCAVNGVFEKLCWEDDSLEVSLMGADGRTFDLKLQKMTAGDDLPYLGEELDRDQLLGRAKLASYDVQEEAERTFQARQAVKEARGNLLPRLRLSSLIGVFTGDVVDVAGDFLPFLFPSNWYRFEAQKSLAEAQVFSFNALKANQMNAVDGIYYSYFRDEALFKKLNSRLNWLRKTGDAIQQQENLRLLPTGTADAFNLKTYGLETDARALELMTQNGLTQLRFALALPIDATELALKAPDLDEVPLRGGIPLPLDIFATAEQKSVELKAGSKLIEASRSMRGSVAYSFLDIDGGGLGFGRAASLRIARSETAVLENKQKSLLAQIKQQSTQLVAAMRTTQADYLTATQALKAATSEYERTIRGLLQGDEDFTVEDLAQSSQELIDWELQLMAKRFEWSILQTQYQRLIRSGLYAD
ncbi:MAG: hypothetical protein ACLGG0_07985 [Bacteriovoracia bacterium]